MLKLLMGELLDGMPMEFGKGMKEANKVLDEVSVNTAEQVKQKFGNMLLIIMREVFQRPHFQQRLSSHILDYCHGSKKKLEINPEWVKDITKNIHIHDNEIRLLNPQGNNMSGGKHTKKRVKKKCNRTKKNKNKQLHKKNKRYVGGSINHDTTVVRLDNDQLNELTSSMRNFFTWTLNQPAEMLNTMQSQIVFTKNKLLQDPDFMMGLIDTFQRAIYNVFYSQLHSDSRLSNILEREVFRNENFQSHTKNYLDELLVGKNKIERFKGVLENQDVKLKDEPGVKTLQAIVNKP